MAIRKNKWTINNKGHCQVLHGLGHTLSFFKKMLPHKDFTIFKIKMSAQCILKK